MGYQERQGCSGTKVATPVGLKSKSTDYYKFTLEAFELYSFKCLLNIPDVPQTNVNSAIFSHYFPRPDREAAIMSKYYDGVEFPFCDEFSKYEKMAKIGQGTFGCVFCHKEYELIPPCRSYLLLCCYVLAWLTLAVWHPRLLVGNETTLRAMVVLKPSPHQSVTTFFLLSSPVFNREVFKAKHRQTGKKVALKKVLMENEKEGVRSCSVSSRILLHNLKSSPLFSAEEQKVRYTVTFISLFEVDV